MNRRYKFVLYRTIKMCFIYFLLLFFSFIIIYPFAWMVVASLRPEHSAIWTSNLIEGIFPKKLSFDAYKFLLEIVGPKQFLVWLQNSVIYSVASTVINVIFCTLAAYSIADRNLPGRQLFISFFLISLIIPQQLIAIQLFLLVHELGLLNTYAGIILPLAAEAFSILIIYRFFTEIPKELLDAARIDGAGELGVLWHVVLPLARPIIGTVILMQFVGAWNAFTVPLMLGQKDEFRNLQVAMAYFNSALKVDFRAVMALGSVITVPVLILFIFTQRAMIRGITAGAIQGGG